MTAYKVALNYNNKNSNAGEMSMSVKELRPQRRKQVPSFFSVVTKLLGEKRLVFKCSVTTLEYDTHKFIKHKINATITLLLIFLPTMMLLKTLKMTQYLCGFL